MNKIKSALLPLIITLPVFTASASDQQNEQAQLKQQLELIQKRLSELENKTQNTTKSIPANTSFNVYGTLRPTFGVTSGDKDIWDVGDALSRVGFKTEHKLTNGLTGFAKGEFKVNIQANGDFGEARKAYVGIKGDFGRFTIGKQASAQYNMIADSVDIFNRSATPLAYDSISPFRVNNLVTYRKEFGAISISVDSQFNGSDKDNSSDFFNTGIQYKTNAIKAAVAYYDKSRDDGATEKALGVSIAKDFGSLYLATSYQDIEIDDIDGSTLDVVGAYAINEIYKLKIGISQYDDGLAESNSDNYQAYNTTLEWQGTPDFRLFVEYQHNNFEYKTDNDQIMIGMRYNFDYKF
jgi:predicted porin